MLFVDTETCGFHGVVVLIQYAEDDGEIFLHDCWKHTAQENIDLLVWIASKDICGFNLTFDWFHIQKFYNMLEEYKSSSMYNEDAILEDVVKDLVEVEPWARDGSCIKPKTACDLMLHARKGPYQSTMDRKDIRVKRVPTLLADLLAKELHKRIPLPDIYFARRKKQVDCNWSVVDIFEDDVLIRDFKDVVLKFKASSGLKALAVDLGIKSKDDVMTIGDEVGVDKKFMPVEKGHAPFAKAAGKGAWPDVLEHHINYWAYNPLGRKYASDDIVITRSVYYKFGSPESDDNDSVLACAVGSIRWKGFAIDLPGIKARRQKILEKAKDVPVAPRAARKWLETDLSEIEIVGMGGSTAAPILEDIAKWTIPCSLCDGEKGEMPCPECKDEGETPHPAAIKAEKIMEARQAIKEVEVYDKLIEAGRFHASFTIIGTRSNRMSGSTMVEGGKERSATLNPQGIKNRPEVRVLFPLADPNDPIMELCGGDFESFEVSIAEAVYEDPDLRIALLSGKKLHALFGVELYGGDITYEDVMATKGESHGMYDIGKHGVFTLMFGGDENTLVNKYGVDEELAFAGTKRFLAKYKGVGRAQARNYEKFCSMRQPGGIGSKVEWHDPADYVESMLGFRRYFTLENQICKALFMLGEDPPKEWLDLKIRVLRRDRQQFAGNAVRSALFGSAFGIQAQNMRAAANHEIQSPGGQITKDVQRNIWDLQPCGVSVWRVMPINIHDEILVVHRKELKAEIENKVDTTVAKYQNKIPLLKMEWESTLKNWAEK